MNLDTAVADRSRRVSVVGITYLRVVEYVAVMHFPYLDTQAIRCAINNGDQKADTAVMTSHISKTR